MSATPSTPEPAGWLQRWDLLPHVPRGGETPPNGKARMISAIVLGVLVLAYLVVWVQGNWVMLADPDAHNDDVRTLLFPFHDFAPGPDAFANDPVAQDMVALTPPALRLMYQILVPSVGFFWAPKIVQLMCFGLFAVAALRLIVAKPPLWAAAALMVFLLCHTPAVMVRINGGLPRALAYGVFALWLSGMLVRCEWTRYIAIWLSAMTYPSSMLILLAVEGMVTLMPWTATRGTLIARFRRAILAVVVTAAIIVPFRFGAGQLGHVHSYEEAIKEPAFSQQGRLRYLPFQDPVPRFTICLAAPFGEFDKKPHSSAETKLSWSSTALPIVIGSILLGLVIFRLAPIPWVTLAFAAASVFLYIAARLLAFQLYAPERFYSYGMIMCGITGAVEIIGRLGWRFPKASWPGLAQNVLAIAMIGGLWLLTGNGFLDWSKNTIRPPEGEFLAFVKTMPPEVRIACHPHDQDIPFWAGRSTTDNYETLQPWIVERWNEYRARTQETMQALYATDVSEIFRYAEKHGITHLHLNRARYGPGMYRGGIIRFEPLTTYSANLLRSIDPRNLAVLKLPAESVVYSDQIHIMVDVTKWRSLTEAAGY
jgi:hypothetical protein